MYPILRVKMDLGDFFPILHDLVILKMWNQAMFQPDSPKFLHHHFKQKKDKPGMISLEFPARLNGRKR